MFQPFARPLLACFVLALAANVALAIAVKWCGTILDLREVEGNPSCPFGQA